MQSDDQVIVRGPGEGRAYEIGPMRGVFKADGVETADRYCVSEWSVQPGCDGPGPHSHEANEELFLVTQGTMSFRVGDGLQRLHPGRVRGPVRLVGRRIDPRKRDDPGCFTGVVWRCAVLGEIEAGAVTR